MLPTFLLQPPDLAVNGPLWAQNLYALITVAGLMRALWIHARPRRKQ
jgi:hypothetical protein